MKRSILLISTLAMVIVACHTNKSITRSASNEPTEVQLTAGKTKFPEMTMATLKKGHSVFYGACTNCHGAKNISNYSEEEFSGILDKMAPKADLTSEEKEAVLKYAVAVKLAKH